MRVAIWGNTEPPHSTENEYRKAWGYAGHEVECFQEGSVDEAERLIGAIVGREVDLVQWTRTRGLSDRIGDELQWKLLTLAARAGVPVVGVHLDIWIGFEREAEVAAAPYFRCDLMLTADGGNQDAWERYGINHRWLLPAISQDNLGIGTPRDEYRSKVAFVGSWQGHYHPEAKHRHELIAFLNREFDRSCAFWPKQGQHAVRGRDLNDLYASVDVVVGDSAVLPGKDRYLSDRTPESMGRGAILLHPAVGGVNAAEGDPFHPEAIVWPQGDWAALRDNVESLLAMSSAE